MLTTNVRHIQGTEWDWLTFISTIINSLAWPLAIVLIIWWLKDYIKKLIPNTSKVKYGDFEIEFSQGIEELKIETSKLKKIHPIENVPQEAMKFLQNNALKTSPRTIIVESWISLELTANSLAIQYYIIDTEKKLPFRHIIKAYEEKQVLQRDEVLAITKLEKLRNQALHDLSFDITIEEAKEYAISARNMEDIIMSECWKKFGGCRH